VPPAPAQATVAAPAFPGYSVESLIGQGGMAQVFRARALEGPLAGHPVALKRLRPNLATGPTFLELFRREGELGRALCHPAVVEVYGTGLAGGVPFIAMEYVDGKNLREVIGQCAARSILLPVEFALFVAHVVAGALDHVHRARDAADRPLGVVHCDVSPANVFISRLGEVKLGDFGIATAIGDAPVLGAFGKVRYLAPERLRGEAPGPEADLFALGAVLFELLTDQPAFPGSDADAVARRVVSGERRRPSELRPDVPEAVDALVLRALAVRPRDRLADAATFAAELSALYDPSVGTPLAIAAVVRGLFGPGAAVR
jgi:serine/threonine protein kinase